MLSKTKVLALLLAGLSPLFAASKEQIEAERKQILDIIFDNTPTLSQQLDKQYLDKYGLTYSAYLSQQANKPKPFDPDSITVESRSIEQRKNYPLLPSSKSREE